jgi:hypothetical protein
MLPFSWATDIHFDHADRSGTMAPFLAAAGAGPKKALLVTGDISVAPKLIDHLKVLAMTKKDVYFLLGNHDFYGGSIQMVVDYVTNWLTGKLTDPKVGLCPLNLHYLPISGVVAINKDSVLIGVDGYADGRAGNLLGSNIWLNDYVVCRTFNGCDDSPAKRPRLQAILNQLGDESVAQFKALASQIDWAKKPPKTVYVATHAPPFQEAHFAPDGKLGDAHWAPHFVNAGLGDAIKRVAMARPGTQFVVLAGHTHTGCRAKVAPNVLCLVGQANYGKPVLQDPKQLGYRAVQAF